MSHPFPEASSVGSGGGGQSDRPSTAGEEVEMAGGPSPGHAGPSAQGPPLSGERWHSQAHLWSQDASVKWPLVLRALEVTPAFSSRKET